MPPASSTSTSPHRPAGGTSLPVELTSFVGRDRELGELLDHLASSRLLTLTGAGGSGKSRLALEAVARMVVEQGGVDAAWVELAGIQDPSLIARQVADACGRGEELGKGDAAGLVELLRGRELLLVLDNCEHLVDACAALADLLLRGCPDLRILATSREALGIRGERAWLVPALSLPPEGASTPEALESAEAVRLFVERARDVQSGFELNEANAGAIADICRRLDGIPLAIELAAARVRVLPPEQIQARLDDAFRLLTSGSRTAIARHRTLRAAIDWSYDLLEDDARSLLRRLSPFRGGFSLDAVEAVGAGAADPAAAADPLDQLSQLVDRSLVVVREQGGLARYGLLETVRQYAALRLAESGGEQDARRRHAEFVVRMVAEAEPHFIRTERKRWVEALLADLENIREALAWTRANDGPLHLRLVGMLWWFWYSTRHWTEARAWIGEALALPAATTSGRSRASVLFAAGALAALQSRPSDARPLLEEARALAAAAGDASLEAYALNYLGMTYAGEGDPRGMEYSRRAGDWFEAHGDLYGHRLALLLQGTVAMVEGDLERAEALNLQGVRVARAFGQDRELAVSLQNVTVVHLAQKDYVRAEVALREALAASRRDPSYFFIAAELQYMGELMGHAGRPLRAARILGASAALRDMIAAAPFRIDQLRLGAALPAFRSAAGEEAFERAWAEGRTLSPEAATDEILGDEGPDGGPGADAAGPVATTPQAGGEARLEQIGGDPGGAGAGPSPSDHGHAPEQQAAGPAPAGERPHFDLGVRALGPLHVEVQGRPVQAEAWAYAKPKELLVYLLTHPAGRTRDEIGQALWPEAEPARVKNSFHVTVHHLRKALGHPEWLVRDGERYLLSPSLRVDFDVARFQADARAALKAAAAGDADAERLGRVMDRYAGEFLEGHVPLRWTEEERDLLRRLQLQLGLARGRLFEEAGADASAADVYRALTLRDELNEEAHRRLMQCWARSGDRARALRHFDALVDLLRDALGAEPEAETRAVRDRIRAGVG